MSKKLRSPEDMEPGRNYIFVYRTAKGRKCQYEGRFLRIQVYERSLWYMFDSGTPYEHASILSVREVES